jgi:predicted anti-sigma-YlaC factor YlaD
MDCAEFEVLLFDELDRELASADVDRMQAHLLTCTNCRRLYSLVRRDDQQGVTELPHDFAAGVVASTSGRPCERAQLLLAASEDDASDDGWLLARHLESCADCSAVAGALARLQLELPTLAEADPGEGFVPSVMAATFGVRRGQRGSQRSSPHRLIEQLIRRPRIALEGAYAIAGLVLVAFTLTSPPFSELPARAVGDTWRFVADTAHTVGAGIGELNAITLTLVDQVAESASANAVELGANVSGSARELVRTAWDGLLAPNLEEVRSLWNEKVSGAVEPDTGNPANRR